MFNEFLSLMHAHGIPGAIDLASDVGFIILVPFAIYYCLRGKS